MLTFLELSLIAILTLVYLGINLVLIGINLGINEKKPTKMEVFFVYPLMLFVALPLTIAVYFYDYWIAPLAKALQLPFLWKYIFNRKRLKSTTETMIKVAELYANKTVSKLELFCVKLAFRYNRFTPPEFKTGIDWLRSINPIHKFVIIAPDGWMPTDNFMSFKITKADFVSRCKRSMCKHIVTFNLNTWLNTDHILD